MSTHQPRLPGDVGDVQDQERPTPAVAELPDNFRLTPETAARTKPRQDTLFSAPATVNPLTRTHKATGWTRTPEGFGIYQIHPSDGTPDRRVKFLSPGTWQNDPGDDRANVEQPRVLVIEGPALPAWAAAWLDGINARQCDRARDTFRAALDDAAWHSDSRDGW